VWILILILKVVPTFFQELAVKEERAKYYSNMQHAPSQNSHDSNTSYYDASFTTESHPSDPDCSLVPSRAEIDALEHFDGWTEAEWIDKMCEEEAQDDSGDDEMDIEVNVSKLLVTNDSGTCTTDLEFLSRDSDSHWATLNNSGVNGPLDSDSDWHETALHNDAILAGLSGLTLDADSFDSGHSVSSTPPSSPVLRPLIFTLEAPPPAQPVTTTCVVPSSLANQRVTAMQIFSPLKTHSFEHSATQCISMTTTTTIFSTITLAPVFRNNFLAIMTLPPFLSAHPLTRKTTNLHHLPHNHLQQNELDGLLFSLHRRRKRGRSHIESIRVTALSFFCCTKFFHCTEFFVAPGLLSH
jgi:hypothetical protein